MNKSKNKEYSIVFYDEHLIIVNKNSGVLALPDRWDTSVKSLDAILAEDILAYSPDSENKKIYPVHRIDKDTSGLIMYALTEEMHKLLSIEFQNRNIEKTYHAVISGCPAGADSVNNGNEETSFYCDAKLLPDGDKLHRTLIDNKHGKKSYTEFRVLKKMNKYSLIEAKPITGRTHQIRVHLQFLGYPILCDSLYGKIQKIYLSEIKRGWRGDKYEERPLLQRLALHAYSLKFIHPISKEVVQVCADYPKDLKSFIAQCSKK